MELLTPIILFSNTVDAWVFAVSMIVTLIIVIPVSGYIGFLIARNMVKKELKNNPIISEKQIRAMFMAMGRKPSEAQIRQVMNSIRNQK